MPNDNDMIPHRNHYLFSDDMLPVRKHQAYDEVFMLEKQMAGAIYYQRCLEKDL